MPNLSFHAFPPKQVRVKTTHPETVKIDVKEYQPIAVLNEEFYLTQDGNLINPGKVNIEPNAKTCLLYPSDAADE